VRRVQYVTLNRSFNVKTRTDQLLYAVNRDDFISKYRMLNLTKEEHASSTMTG
jgi:hypothetical protein